MYSQYNEEEIVLNYFIGQTNLRFLDIGSNDGISFSNTYQLSIGGWSGVCLDPSPTAFKRLLKTHLNNNNVSLYNFGISDTSGKKILNESGSWDDNPNNPPALLSCIDPNEKSRYWGISWEEVDCDFVTFDLFLKIVKDHKFDFINIDCEGHDYVVLRQIDLNYVNCKMICIEYTDDDSLSKYIDYCSQFGFAEIYRNEINIILTLIL